jgi:histidinol-phosphate aminotransferase
MKTFDFNDIVRPHLKQVKPYRSARNDFEGAGYIQLDANENPYPEFLNRYPDPFQKNLKQKIGELRNCKTDNIFIGNGSDEAIDLLIRACCEPGRDNIIIPTPTYGMYRVSAEINNIKVKEVLLDEAFNLDTAGLMNATDAHSKIIFLCSPNNPTGNCFQRESIVEVIRRFNGLVVVDEAYIDFSTKASLLSEIKSYANLVILQTLSKAAGLAGARLGMCFSSIEIIEVLNRIKPPYNISILNQEAGLNALNKNEAGSQVTEIIKERDQLTEALQEIKYVEKVFASEANFLLVRIKNPTRCYEFLKANGIIVRDRSHEPLCAGCLRITIGTIQENQKLLEALKNYNPDQPL